MAKTARRRGAPVTGYEAPRIGVLMGRRLRDALAVQAIAVPVPFPCPGVRKGT